MSRNAEIAAQFDEIADRMNLLGEGWFKIRAYRRAAEVMRAAAEDVAALSATGRLNMLEGIGRAIAQKTADYLTTGSIPLLERLRGQTTDGELALLRAGLTPAQVRELRDRLDITSLDGLSAALARSGQDLDPKTVAAAQRALQQAGSQGRE